MCIGKVNDLESVELRRQTFEPYLNAFERKAVCFVDGGFRNLGQITGKLAQGLFGRNVGIYTLGELSSFWQSRTHPYLIIIPLAPARS
jgi:hypothetical protein